MKDMQWDEKHYKELTVQKVHPDIQHYLDTRHLVRPSEIAPYTPPDQSLQPYKDAGEAVTALIVAVGKPLAMLSALGGIVCVVVAVVVATVWAVLTFVSTYALWIGGGVFAVAGLAVAIFGAKGSGESQSAPPPPNDGGRYEWYQEQKQGWRKV